MTEPAPIEAKILHRGAHYIARYLDCDDSPDIIVSFEYWKPEPTLDGEFSGEGFFRNRRMNAIGVMAATNDWFQHDEILVVIAAIKAATPGRRLIGYGGSMGGFAAINFADWLGLDHLVAVIPQFSIDRRRAPYEIRWRDEAAVIDFRHDRVDQVLCLRQGWIVYDPWCVDGQHVRDIQRTHALAELKVYFGGHAQFLMLQQANLFTQMLLDMLDGSFDRVAFVRAWRVARRDSAAFWLNLGGILLWRGQIGRGQIGRGQIGRGQIAAARRCLAQARMRPHPEPQGFVDLAGAIDAAAAQFGARAAAAETAFPPPAPAAAAVSDVARRPVWRRLAARVRRMILP